jgi:hypothetical protein
VVSHGSYSLVTERMTMISQGPEHIENYVGFRTTPAANGCSLGRFYGTE